MGQLEADSYTADRWFLSRGLPAVVHRSSLLRRLWSRSAPALAGLSLIAANSVAVVAISGEHTIDIAGRPDLRQSLVLGLLAVALPLAALALAVLRLSICGCCLAIPFRPVRQGSCC